LALAIAPYERLLRELVAGQISPNEFQDRYLDTYLNLDTDLGYEVFKIVDGFFGLVESYVDEPDLRESGDPTAEDLKRSAIDLLRRAGDL
jgi:hypothetical protein